MGQKTHPASASEFSKHQVRQPDGINSWPSREHSSLTPWVTWANFQQLDHGHRTVARSRSPFTDPPQDTVDPARIIETDQGYEYGRSGDYPTNFPRDHHLYDKIKHEIFGAGIHGPKQACMLEQAILQGRDILDGTAPRSEPLFQPGEPRSWKFPIGVDAILPEANKLTRAPLFVPARWGTTDGTDAREHPDYGLFLAPCKWGYRDEPLTFNCLAMKFKAGVAVGWFNDLKVRRAHVFRPGAVEFTDYVLLHYKLMLDQVGLYHSVYASRFQYPIFKGLCCGLMDVYLKEFNTFCTAEGETSLDLWSLHRLSGLPIDGEPYEEVCWPDVLKDQTDGVGNYNFGYSYRYLMKVYRDLYHDRLDQAIVSGKKSDNKRRVPINVWLQTFFYGDLRYDNFPTDGHTPSRRLKASRNEKDLPSFLKGECHKGENPMRVDPTTHLAAYLTYWLCTFAVPNGDENLIRPDAIYPACQLAWGTQLAICPVTLCLIFRMLRHVCSQQTPRDSTTVGPIHFFSVWSATLFPSFVDRNDMVSTNLFPKMLEYAGVSAGSSSKQLCDIRNALTDMPLQKSGSSIFWSLSDCSRPSVSKLKEFHDGDVEKISHPRTGKELIQPALSADLRAWALSIRPSVLVYRKGQSTIFEPYYPFRFARNFGYDQHIPSQSHVFAIYKRSSSHVGDIALARKWWDYYQRSDSSLFRVPKLGRQPRVTPEYVKWWQSKIGPYQRVKTECWIDAEKAFLKAQKEPPFDIDEEYLEQLLDASDAKKYSEQRRRAYTKAHRATTLAYNPPLQRLEEKEFTNQYLGDFKVNAPGADLTEEPFPQEENITGREKWQSKKDPEHPGFLSYDSSKLPGLNKKTSWVFVLLTNCMLQEDNSDVDILTTSLPKSYQYADGWGIDHLNLYYCLAVHGHHDLASLAKCAKTVNDVMYLVKEGAKRSKANTLEYWPVSSSYNGPPAKPTTKSRYWRLVTKATRPSYFDELEDVPLPPPQKKAKKERSMAQQTVDRAKEALPKLTQEAQAEEQAFKAIEETLSPARGFEEFTALHAATIDLVSSSAAPIHPNGIKDTAPLLLMKKYKRMKNRASKNVEFGAGVQTEPEQEALGNEQASEVQEKAVSPPAGSETPSAPSAAVAVSASPASTVEKTPLSDPLAINNIPKHTITCLARFPCRPWKRMQEESDDVYMVVDGKPKEGHAKEMTEGAQPVGQRGAAPSQPSVEAEDRGVMQHIPPLSMESTGCAPLSAMGVTPWPTVSHAIAEIGVTDTDAGAVEGSSHQLLTTEASNAVASPSQDTTTCAVNWAVVDGEVQVEVPSSPPLLVTQCDAVYMEYLKALKQLVNRSPSLPYSTVKQQVDRMTLGLHAVGHPLEEWLERATLVLRHVRRWEFTEELIAIQTCALGMERAECEKQVHSLELQLTEEQRQVEELMQQRKILDDQVAQLEEELARARDGQEVARCKLVEQRESLVITESQLASTVIKIMELNSEEVQLMALKNSSSIGLPSLDEIFREIE